MPRVKDVCAHVRSKNAGPFWITVDLFFDGADNFYLYGDNPALAPAVFARLYGVDPTLVKRFTVERLNTIKVSFPRPHAQGWMHERDMHGGQQYVALLDIELTAPPL